MYTVRVRVASPSFSGGIGGLRRGGYDVPPANVPIRVRGSGLFGRTHQGGDSPKNYVVEKYCTRVAIVQPIAGLRAY